MRDAPSGSEVFDARRLDALRHALGETIVAALLDPEVVEVMANPDGRLVVERARLGRSDAGEVLSPQARERAIRLVADYMGVAANRLDPRLSGVLPLGGERFQAFLPPLASGPAFSIRKRSARFWTLDDYADQGVMTPDQVRLVREAVETRCNLVVSGGTGAGKTTLANAILAEPGFATDRVFLIEDTAELQCQAWDLVSVLTQRTPIRIGVGDLVRDALRMRPDRIVIGEMRDGAAALETLKAWNTGHPGGLSTLHANSAQDVPARLEDLISEVAARPAHRLIGQAVDRIIHIRRSATGRVVDAVLAVEPADQVYALRRLDLQP